MAEKVTCAVCGKKFDWLSPHLKTAHGISSKEYRKQFPGQPIISDEGKKRMAARPQSQGTKRVKRIAAGAGANGPVSDSPADPNVLVFGSVSIRIRDDSGSEEDHEFIPEHDPYFQPDDKLFELIALGAKLNTPVLLHGPTGCGKSSSVMEMAAILSQPIRRVSLNGDFAAADFIGEKTIQADENGLSIVSWQDGLLPQAMRAGHWLLVDEVDTAHPSVIFALQSVLEGAPLVLAGNGGEIVPPHDFFRLFATANTLGYGDDTGMYTGTKIMNEATLDRFGIVERVNYLEPEAEATVLKSKTNIDLATAKQMVKVAHEVRQGYDMQACYCTFSTRRLINWANATVSLGDMRRGLTVSVLSRLRPEDREYVRGIAQRVLGIAI